MGKTKDDITDEELGEKLLHAVREMKAGSVSYTHLRAPRDGLLSRMPSSA